jgi:hypothetical protein
MTHENSSRLIDAYWNHLPGCVEAPAASRS